MERLLCKLIAVFISIGLAVSAQATVIVNDSPEFKAIAKGIYFSQDLVNGLKGSYEASRQSGKGAGDSQPYAKLNANLFGGNLLSVFEDISSLAKPAYDISFANELREFGRERFNVSPDGAGAAGNLLDRVKVNTHVPESTSIMLFAIGLFSLAMARRKIKAN